MRLLSSQEVAALTRAGGIRIVATRDVPSTRGIDAFALQAPAPAAVAPSNDRAPADELQRLAQAPDEATRLDVARTLVTDGDDRYAAVICDLLNDPAASVRYAAVRGLLRLSDEHTAPVLTCALALPDGPLAADGVALRRVVRHPEAVSDALAQRAYEALAQLVGRSKHDDAMVADVLAHPRPAMVGLLRAAAASSNPTLRIKAAEGIATLPTEQCAPLLDQLARSHDWNVLLAVARGAANLDSPEAPAILTRILHAAASDEQRIAFLQVLAASSQAHAFDLLEQAVGSGAVPPELLAPLCSTTQARAMPLLRRLSAHPAAAVRRLLTVALGLNTGSNVVGLLVELLHDGDPDVRSAARCSLARQVSVAAAAALILGADAELQERGSGTYPKYWNYPSLTPLDCDADCWQATQTQFRSAIADLPAAAAQEVLMMYLQASPGLVSEAVSEVCKSAKPVAMTLLFEAWRHNATLSPAVVAGCSAASPELRRQVYGELIAHQHDSAAQEEFQAALKLTANNTWADAVASHVADTDAANLEVPLAGITLRSLQPKRAAIIAQLQKRYADVLAAIEHGHFNPESAEHRVVAYLQLLRAQHSVKFTALNPTFTMTRWQELLKTAPKRAGLAATLDPSALTECYYLGYEAWQIKRKIIDPAIARAAQLRRPLLVVANLTYGGTALAPIAVKDLRSRGVQFIATKQGSTDAHGNADVLTPDLFTDEQIAWLTHNQPIVLVLDGSRRERHPDSFQGYRNFFSVLDSARGAGHEPRCGSGEFQQLENKMREIVEKKHNATPFAFALTSVCGERLEFFNKSAKAFDWSDVQGPAVVCVSTPMSNGRIWRSAKPAAKLTRRAVKSCSGSAHSRGYFDDAANLQDPQPYVSRHGYLKLAPPLYPAARAHYKSLVALGTQGADCSTWARVRQWCTRH